MKNYYENYTVSINLGLKTSRFKINKEEIHAEDFFSKLNLKISEVKSKGGRLFFFGNGASAMFK